MTLPSAAEWDAAERRARVTNREWQEGAAIAHIRDTFAGLNPADVDAIGDAAAGLLADATWITALLAPLMRALADDPWFDPPLRVTRDVLRTTVQLLDLPAGVLGATVYDGAALAAAPAHATLVASGRLLVARYHVAHGARLRRWQADPRLSDTAPLRPLPAQALQDGDVVRLDGRRHAHLLEGSGGEVVAVTFATHATAMVREYDRATGALLRTATADQDESRTRLLLTLLRTERRRDAGACFAAATRAPAYHLRWTAMREWLALDAPATLPRLRELARDDPHAEVRALAQATLPMVEDRLCRA